MRSPLLSALLALAPAAASAQDDWGLAAFDAEAVFVDAVWAGQDVGLVVGSGPAADLRLEGLEPAHARFTLADGGRVVAIPLAGAVTVSGTTGHDLVDFTPTADVRVGLYRLQFALPMGAAPLAMLEADTASDAVSGALAARAQELDKASYRFCHDPEYGEEGVVGADFCVILDGEAVREVCPQAARCDAWEAAPERWKYGRVGDGTSSGEGRRVARRRPLVDLPELPPALGWLVIGAIAIALVVVFVQAIRSAGWEDDDLDLGAAELSEAARKLQALPEAKSKALLKMAARALSEKGDAHEAAILVHLAILRHIDDEGLARYHPSKTNGDYLRAIRRHRELAALFKQVARQTERARFGDGRLDEAAVADALARAGDVLDAHRGVGAAPSALLALVALSFGLAACPEAPGTQAYYNHGPAGLSALPALLRGAGLEVEVRRDRLIDLPVDADVVVLRTSAAGEKPWPKELSLDQLLDAGRAVVVIDDFGKSSFFLPSTASVAATQPPEAVDLAFTMAPASPSCANPFFGLERRYAPGAPRGPVRLPRGRLLLRGADSQTSTISDFPLIIDPFLRHADRLEIDGRSAAYGWAAHRTSQGEALSGCLYVFADRDLFTNASLARPANAAAVADLFLALAPPGGKVVFADRLDQWTVSDTDNPFSTGGQDGESPTQALEASNMLPFLLQGLATVALLYVMLGAAFGPLRDRERTEHKAFVEHVEAIGRQYARTGRAGLTHAAGALARLVVMRHRDRIRGGEAGGWAALARDLADKHGLDEAHVRAALRLGIEGKSELGTPGPDDPAPSSAVMLDTLGRLLDGHHRKET